jgi:predicted dehydrogenase/nucleoside-diphosphate-sugar epimerase
LFPKLACSCLPQPTRYKPELVRRQYVIRQPRTSSDVGPNSSLLKAVPMKRVCLVGAGFISDAHAEAVAALPNIRLEAVIDQNLRSAERLARKWAIPNVFGSIEDAIAADGFESAHVLVPPDIHARAALPLIQAGKAVLLEKPFATSSTECDTLLADKKALPRLGVNQNFIFHPAFARLRNIVDSRALGKPNFVTCIYNVPLRQLAAGQFGHWMFLAPGNILLEQAVHPLSQLMVLAGPVDEVRALAGRPLELGSGVPFYSSMSLSLRCQSLPAELRFAVGQSFPFWQVTAVCDDGIVSADILANRTYTLPRTRWSEGIDGFMSGHLTLASIGRNVWRNAVDYGLTTLRFKRHASPFLASIRASIAAFYTALETGKSPECDGRFGAALVSTCEKIRDQLPNLAAPAVGRHSERSVVDTGGAIVAVLGGTGFIGARVVDRLIRRGATVRVMARSIVNLPSDFQRPEVTLCQGDIRSVDHVEAAIGPANSVINLAHGGGGQSWDEIRDSMVAGAENVARACLRRAARLVHVGSIASLYLGQQSKVVTGATLPDPLSDQRADYARAKAICDRLLLKLHAEERLQVTIVRPGLVVGKGTSPFHSGIGFYNNEQHCIGWNSGRNPLPFVLVDDTADAIVAAIFGEGLNGRCFNLVGDVRPSARDYIAHLARALERPLKFHAKSPTVLWSEEFMKWCIKRASGRRPPLPSYRDLLSRGLLANFDCEDAKRALNWTPVFKPDDFWQNAVYVHSA